MRDYSKPLMAMVKKWHELDEERKKLATLAMATIREQRKVPGENNAKFVKYCTDLFIHNKIVHEYKSEISSADYNTSIKSEETY
jgi:hypothetical protein